MQDDDGTRKRLHRTDGGLTIRASSFANGTPKPRKRGFLNTNKPDFVVRRVDRSQDATLQNLFEHYLHDIRLLDAGDLGQLFPGAEIVRERLGGLTKALIAVRRGRDRK